MATFEYVGDGVRVRGRCRGPSARFTVRRDGATVFARLESDAGPTLEAEAAVPPAGPPTPPAEEVALCGRMKRTLLLDHAGQVEDATLVFLSKAEFARAVAGPPLPLRPVTERAEPFGRCVEFYDHRGELCRTEWSSRLARQAA